MEKKTPLWLFNMVETTKLEKCKCFWQVQCCFEILVMYGHSWSIGQTLGSHLQA